MQHQSRQFCQFLYLDSRIHLGEEGPEEPWVLAVFQLCWPHYRSIPEYQANENSIRRMSVYYTRVPFY